METPKSREQKIHEIDPTGEKILWKLVFGLQILKYTQHIMEEPNLLQQVCVESNFI